MRKYLRTIAGAHRALGRRPDPDDDVDTVVSAADLLHIGEFRLFELAYRQWYGREADVKALERPFVHYMFARRAPAWARHFAREVIARAREGRLDPTEFGLPPAQVATIDPERARALCDVGLALVVAVAYAVWTLGG